MGWASSRTHVDWEKGDVEAGTGDVGPGVTRPPFPHAVEVLTLVFTEPPERALSLGCPQDGASVWRWLVQARALGCVNVWPARFLALAASVYGKSDGL